MKTPRVYFAIAAACITVGGAASMHGQMVITQSGSASAGIPGIAGMPGGVSLTPMERGTGIIVGRAMEAGANRSIAGAIVTLTLPAAAPLRVMADAQGQFAFRDLPAGRFSLTATKAGYVDGAFGRVRPAGPAQALTLTADQRVTDIALPLWKFAVIAGRVLDENGEPLVGSSVQALKRSVVAGKRQLVSGGTVTTDDRGMYRLGSLEPGDYVVVVPMTQGSGIDSLFAQLGIPPPPPPPPGGGGGGGNVAFAFTNVTAGGGGGNITVSGSSSSAAAPAGMSPDGHVLTYQTEFYPSALSASRATTVTVTSGEEHAGIDFQLKPVRTVTVSGTINTPAGQPGDMSVTLVPSEADDLVTPIETATAITDGTGAFKFTNIPSGQYTLRVLRTPRAGFGPGNTTTITQGGDGSRMVMTRAVSVSGPGAPAPPLPTDPTLWADMGVSVGTSDMTDVTVPLRNGLKVGGRVEFSGAAERPAADQLPAIAISLEPADGHTSGLGGGTVRGRVDPSGQFSTIGVPPGKYILRVSAPDKWTLRSAIFNGQDITDRPVDLTDADATSVVISFTDKPSGLSGGVTGASGPDASAAVIVFPTDRAMWAGAGTAPRRLKNTRTGPDGSYSFSNLPAGDYFIAAVNDAAAADWQSAEFLAALSRSATRLTIAEGEKKTQALQTSAAPGR